MDLDLKMLKPMRPKLRHCKIRGCSRTGKITKGFCRFHYRRFIAGIIQADGQEIRIPRPKYPKDFECIVCGKRGKISRGFCKTHHSQFLRKKIDFDGVTIAPMKRVVRYTDEDQCKAEGCRRKPRVRGWCETHHKSHRLGIYSTKGKRLKPKNITNKGRKCSVSGCVSEAHCRGLCLLHYHRSRTGYLGPAGYKNKGQNCTEANCSNPAYCRTLCTLHYGRWMRVLKKEQGNTQTV